MGKCCKKKKQSAAAPTAAPVAPAAEAGAHQGGAASLFKGVSLGEAALAAGVLVLLPVVLDKLAPNAVRSIKDGFELASKG